MQSLFAARDKVGVGKVAPRLSGGFGPYTSLESNMSMAGIASIVASRHGVDINSFRGYSVEEMDELVNLLADFIGLQFAQDSPLTRDSSIAWCGAVTSCQWN